MKPRLFHMFFVASALTCLAGLVVAAQGSADANLKNPIASSPESIMAGKAIFQKTCAPCHGLNAEGGPGNDLIPAAPDLTDDMWDHGSTDGAIFANIKNGVVPDFNMTP